MLPTEVTERTEKSFCPAAPFVFSAAIHPHENRCMIDTLAAMLINESFDKE
jgi:hypothetical protein